MRVRVKLGKGEGSASETDGERETVGGVGGGGREKGGRNDERVEQFEAARRGW